MYLQKWAIIGVVAFSILGGRADGAAVITVGDLAILPNSTALLPVYISTTADQSLAGASFELLITTSGPTRLEFANSPAAAMDPTFTAANYVFAGNSADLVFDIPLGTAGSTNVPNDTFFGGDLTADSADAPGPLVNVLLGYLPIATSGILPPTIGDTFTISLIPSEADVGNGQTGFTSFVDSSGTSAAFTSIAGTVTIVPEPATLSLGLITAGLLVVTAKRRLVRIVTR